MDELTRRMNAGDSRAAFALGRIGQDALPPLLALANDHQSTNRVWAILAISYSQRLGTNTHRTIAVLTDALTDPNPVARSYPLVVE